MRYLRSAFLGATVVLALLGPATAAAQITSVSLTAGQLAAQGASVPLQVTVQCDPGWNFAFATATVTQVSGHRLAQGAGSIFEPFPGVPCGTPANLTIDDSSPFAFKQGDATANVTVAVFNPATSSLVEQTVTQNIRLTKK
jgi:hypothetical protein